MGTRWHKCEQVINHLPHPSCPTLAMMVHVPFMEHVTFLVAIRLCISCCDWDFDHLKSKMFVAFSLLKMNYFIILAIENEIIYTNCKSFKNHVSF